MEQLEELRTMIEKMRAEGITTKKISDTLLVSFYAPSLVDSLLEIINKLEKDLTSAYEEMAGEDI